MLIISSQVFRT